jgi:hypothetical protein
MTDQKSLFEGVPSRSSGPGGPSGGDRVCPVCRTVFTPYTRAKGYQLYCSMACRSRAWKHEHGELKDPWAGRDALGRLPMRPKSPEEIRRLKEAGMRQARESIRGKACLPVARQAAEEVAIRGTPTRLADGTADSDRVRELLEEKGIFLEWSNWAGSLFRGQKWEFTGAEVLSRYNRAQIKIWRLRRH